MDIKKLIAKLPTGYAGEVDGMDEARLRAEVLTATGRKARIIRERDTNEELRRAKDLAKNLSAGFADAIKLEDAKLAYVSYMLDEKGRPLLSVGEEIQLDGEAEQRRADRSVILGRKVDEDDEAEADD